MDADDFKELHWLLDVIQSSNIGIVVLDRALHVEVFNRFMQAHSGIRSENAMGKSIMELFADLPEQWLWRRMQTVFELGIPVYTTWEERPYLFRFPLHLPIHYNVDIMYQNVMFVPLRAANDKVERMGIVVYDVTESAMTRQALEHAQAELLQLSRTDRLTSLWTRGYWEERLHEEWERAKRSQQQVSLVMFDIDHFKKINDTHGHQTGDEAIRLVSRTLREVSRDVDICGRYGGEEFCVILPNTPKDGALKFCERVRETIAAGSVLGPAHEVVQFTISLGISELHEDTESVHQWLQQADKALYKSKSAGRNQTRIFNADT
ncbi:MAG TPA: sensor domain-containing diguanylate cyclase [Spongiibacteraceae bacterium]|nr:sensor domain-containing diguanylate cyclase [Spongiibacteraceae bacterium]